MILTTHQITANLSNERTLKLFFMSCFCQRRIILHVMFSIKAVTVKFITINWFLCLWKMPSIKSKCRISNLNVRTLHNFRHNRIFCMVQWKYEQQLPYFHNLSTPTPRNMCESLNDNHRFLIMGIINLSPVIIDVLQWWWG